MLLHTKIQPVQLYGPDASAHGQAPAPAHGGSRHALAGRGGCASTPCQRARSRAEASWRGSALGAANGSHERGASGGGSRRRAGDQAGCPCGAVCEGAALGIVACQRGTGSTR